MQTILSNKCKRTSIVDGTKIVSIVHDEYIGPVVNKKYHGKGAILTMVHGETYSGEFKNGLYDGYGILHDKLYKGYTEIKTCGIFPKIVTKRGNATIYEGTFKNGKRHGHGKITFLLPSYKFTEYIGSVHNDVICGYGRLIGRYGNIYEGLFEDGHIVDGTLTHPSGDEFSGEFKDGVRWKGIYIRKIDGLQFDIKFSNTHELGWISGSGTIYYPDGKVYEGDIKNGKPFYGGRQSYTFSYIKRGN